MNHLREGLSAAALLVAYNRVRDGEKEELRHEIEERIMDGDEMLQSPQGVQLGPQLAEVIKDGLRPKDDKRQAREMARGV